MSDPRTTRSAKESRSRPAPSILSGGNGVHDDEAAWTGSAKASADLRDDSLVQARHQLADGRGAGRGPMSPDVVQSISEVDRQLAKYLTITKLKIENAIAWSGAARRTSRRQRATRDREAGTLVPASSAWVDCRRIGWPSPRCPDDAPRRSLGPWLSVATDWDVLYGQRVPRGVAGRHLPWTAAPNPEPRDAQRRDPDRLDLPCPPRADAEGITLPGPTRPP